MSGGEESCRCNEAINELAKVRNVSSQWCCLHLHYHVHNPHYFHDPQYLSLPSNSIKLTALPPQYAEILDSLLFSFPDSFAGVRGFARRSTIIPNTGEKYPFCVTLSS
jgi:hypothetical protein